MFIGRDHELEVLSKYLDSAFMGNGKTIFVRLLKFPSGEGWMFCTGLRVVDLRIDVKTI